MAMSGDSYDAATAASRLPALARWASAPRPRTSSAASAASSAP